MNTARVLVPVAPPPLAVVEGAALRRFLPVITHSEKRSFRACRRAHYLRYQLLKRPLRSSDPLRFGSLFHRGLEAWWRAAMSGEDRLNAALGALRSDRVDAIELARAEALMVGYHVRWENETLEVLAVEAEFTAPIVNPSTGAVSRTFQLGGKIDAIARLDDGLVYVVEHKCLAGSTRIFDHRHGRFYTLRELCEANEAPLVSALAADGTVCVAQAKVPVRQPAQPTVHVRSASGRTLVASLNHPIWTTRGWVPAGELTTDDSVALPRQMSGRAPGAAASDEAIRLLGYMIGDGCLSNMSFCKNDERVLADVVHCGRAFGETPRRLDDDERATTLFFRGQGLVAGWLARAGLAGGAKEKRVPRGLALSDRQCGQLLAALWSTDGCIDTFQGRKPRIIYTSVSEALCHDIQELLQRLGMVSSVNATSVPYNGERRPVFTTKIISRASKHRFVELVRDGHIPLTRSAVDLETFERAIPDSPQASDEALQPAPCDTLWWDRVLAVDAGQDEVLYDVEVPGVHTFVAEGIVTHNTSSETIDGGSDYWKRLRLDAQVSDYFVGARALGFDVAGCLYDVIGKPKVAPFEATPPEKRQYTKKDGRLYAGQREADETIEEFAARLRGHVAENFDRYFRRGKVVRLAEEERDAALDTWQIAREIREAQLADRYPRNPESCVRWGQTCEFFSVCTREADLNDRTLFRTAATAHEELTQPTATPATLTHEALDL